MQHDAMQPSAPRRALRPHYLLRSCTLHGCQTHKRWAVPTLVAGAALLPAFAPPLSRESLGKPHKARSLSMLHSGLAMGDSTCNNNPRSVNRCGVANACPGKFLVPDRCATNAADTAHSSSSSVPLPASPCACPQEDRINVHDTVQLCMHAALCKNSRTR